MPNNEVLSREEAVRLLSTQADMNSIQINNILFGRTSISKSFIDVLVEASKMRASPPRERPYRRVRKTIGLQTRQKSGRYTPREASKTIEQFLEEV